MNDLYLQETQDRVLTWDLRNESLPCVLRDRFQQLAGGGWVESEVRTRGDSVGRLEISKAGLAGWSMARSQDSRISIFSAPSQPPLHNVQLTTNLSA